MNLTSGLGGAGTAGAGVGGAGSGSSYQSTATARSGGNLGGDQAAGNRGFQLNFVGGTGNTQRNDQGVNQPGNGAAFDPKPLLWIGGALAAALIFRRFSK